MVRKSTYLKLPYIGHKARARHAGIDFQFTYEEWCQWWEKHLGLNWRKLRGHDGEQYVMARNGDKGPYHPSNVRCITCRANSQEIAPRRGEKHPRARLTRKQAMEIKNSTEHFLIVSKKYDITPNYCHMIRNGTRWKCLEE